MSDPTLTTAYPALSGPITAIEEYLPTEEGVPTLVRVLVNHPTRGQIVEMYFADDLEVHL